MPENTDQSNSGVNSEAASSGATLSNAAPHEITAHRNALGNMLQALSAKGIDDEQLAEKAGVPSNDVDALSHDDLVALTVYIAQNHADVLQSVAARFPAAQRLMAVISGNQLGDVLGGIFGSKPRQEES